MTTLSGINTFQAYSPIKPTNTKHFTDAKFSDVINKANAKNAPPSAEQIEQNSQSESVIKQLNFTSMTLQEVRDWVSYQLRTGQMTSEEPDPLYMMTIRVTIVGGRTC